MVRPSSRNLNEYIKQSTRLTVIFETGSFIHNYSNVGGNPKQKIINSYDLLACRLAQVQNPQKSNKGVNLMESLFEQVCTKTDCDIIQVDCSQRLSFFIQKTPVKLALQRGAVFELSYGQGMLENEAAFRKYFLNNCLTLIKICKGGKGIILSAETNRRIFMRSPIDVMQIG